MMTAILLLLVLLTITTSSLLISSSGATTFVVNGFDLNRIHHHRQVIVSLGRTTTTRISSLGRQRQRRVGNCVELCSNSTGEFGEDKKRISQSTSVALLSSSIISVRGGSSSSSSSSNEAVIAPRKKRQNQILPIGVALIIGTFSILEIIQSLRDETERYFGHAHGILILSLIRLFRSVAILQTEVVEFEEATEKLFNQSEDDETESDKKKKRRLSLSTIIGKFIVSRKVSITACIMASIASLVEVYDDLKPGGHHGAVFLAFSELNYQLHRCHDIRTPSKRKEDADKKNRTIQSKSSSLTWKRFIGPTLFIAAAVFAAYELYEDIKPGAHHAVAVLALAELVENINRSKVLKKLNNNGGRSQTTFS